MKIKPGFILRKFSNTWLVIADDDHPDLKNALITLSDSGAYVGRLLEENRSESELIDLITQKYDVSESLARQDLQAFLSAAHNAGLIDNT